MTENILANIPSYKAFPHWYVPLILIVTLIVTYSTLWLFWDKPLLAMLILSLLSSMLLFFFRSYKIFAVFILVALLGTLHDLYFIAHGMWFYGAPMHGTVIPLYLPITWGIISIMIVSAFKIIHILTPQKYHTQPPFYVSLGATFGALITALIGMSIFSDNHLLIIGWFILVDIIYLLIMRSLPLALIGIIAVCGGSIGEITSVALGAWSYSSGSITGIPSFIFVGWDVIGMIVAGTYSALDAPDAPWNKSK